MEKSCFEIQKEILTQKTASEVFDQQIDFHQEEATSNLKHLIIQDHFLTQHVLITEMYNIKRIKKPLEFSAFVATENDVQSNFASLELPDDISKGPMKAFLNNLFDDLDTFLPSFYKLNISNFPKSSLNIDPAIFLLRCVFPSLFGYCWSEEAAISYGKNIASWFGGIYQEVFKSNPEIFNIGPNGSKPIEAHWITHAIRGYFTSIDLNPFINAAIRPIFFDFVQLENQSIQSDPQILVKFAIKLVESIHQNFSYLPNCLNTFFNELLSFIPEENAQNQLIQYVFYDILISPYLRDPILSCVSDVQLPKEDYLNFFSLNSVFDAKFESFSENNKELIDKIKKVPDFASFNPMIVKEDMINKLASYKFPLLEKFCNIVQCAHQPLIMTTHYLAVLFRFAEALQAAKALPKSLERPLNNVVQESIADRLESLPDHLFWFPCYSLAYVNVPPVKFIKESKTTPLYRLLSSKDLRISPFDTDFVHALENAGAAATLTTHPELITEVQWLLKNSQNSFHNIFDEIQIKQQEIDSKRSRALELCSLAQILNERVLDIPCGARRALAMSLLKEFEQYSKQDIQSSNFMIKIRKRINDFCGNSFEVMGKQIAESILVVVTPSIKRKLIDYDPTNDSEDIQTLRSLVNRPILTSSFYSTASKLIPNLIALSEYSKFNGESIENILRKALQPPFFSYVEYHASNFLSLLFPLPLELLSFVFTKKDLDYLGIFSKLFAKKH